MKHFRGWKASKLLLLAGAVFLSAVFALFVLYAEISSAEEFERDLMKHIRVIENALWLLDPSTPLEYLPIVMKYENLLEVRVSEPDGKPFLELESPLPDGPAGILLRRGVIRTKSVEKELKHDGMLLGSVYVEYYQGNFFRDSYFLGFLSLMFVLYAAFLRSLRDNREILRKSAELSSTVRELRTTQEQLVASEKQASLGRLVSGVAHEINTPIGMAYTYLTFLQDRSRGFREDLEAGDFDDAEWRKFHATLDDSLESSINSIRKVADLIRHFKQISVAGETPVKDSFDLNELLSTFFEHVRRDFETSGLRLDFIAGEPIMMESYPGDIVRVMNELVANARDHAFESADGEGVIVMTSPYGGDRVRITFEDDGRGIDDEIGDRLFDPFFTTRHDEGHTGLGLHIAYNIVSQSLGGTIGYERKRESGAFFEIVLPRNV